jgi:hypothetical protein
MKSKLIQIPYTIGIIKPHLALKDEKVTPDPLTHCRSKKFLRSWKRITFRFSTVYSESSQKKKF